MCGCFFFHFGNNSFQLVMELGSHTRTYSSFGISLGRNRREGRERRRNFRRKCWISAKKTAWGKKFNVEYSVISKQVGGDCLMGTEKQTENQANWKVYLNYTVPVSIGVRAKYFTCCLLYVLRIHSCTCIFLPKIFQRLMITFKVIIILERKHKRP